MRKSHLLTSLGLGAASFFIAGASLAFPFDWAARVYVVELETPSGARHDNCVTFHPSTSSGRYWTRSGEYGQLRLSQVHTSQNQVYLDGTWHWYAGGSGSFNFSIFTNGMIQGGAAVWGQPEQSWSGWALRPGERCPF